ncbi:hypothetical protein [Streptomyces sp. NPDC005374]|uniref:hypothetical protein n=1 Tax=Streptomyces sp. NPDC005374 TaxID=3364713 RepID=UPI00368A446D
MEKEHPSDGRGTQAERREPPLSVEGTRAKLKRLVKLGILAEADTGNFARK